VWPRVQLRHGVCLRQRRSLFTVVQLRQLGGRSPTARSQSFRISMEICGTSCSRGEGQRASDVDTDLESIENGQKLSSGTT
jgi:hypothetical protein